MKTLKNLVLTSLVAALFSIPVLSQNLDTNRMDRDLKIMENILSEFFKTQTKFSNTTAPTVRARAFTFLSGNSSSRVKGTYVPGYGAIFMIPNPAGKRIILRGDNKINSNVIFEYSTGEEGADRSIDRESVVDRITEFLQDYGSTIGQLQDEERVLVIFGSQAAETSNFGVAGFGSFMDDSDEEEEEARPLPVISVSASKKDLDAYRKGSLSSEAFKNRLQISDSVDEEKLDLKVLANIFKTALGEGDGDQFHLINNTSLSYLYLDNFGALYSLDLHRGHGLNNFRTNVFTTRIVSPDSSKVKQEERVIEIERLRSELTEQQEKTEEILKKEYQKLIERTKEFMIDYGRTLNSLKTDQYLLVSLNITDPVDGIPQRVDFQVGKSTLNQMDRGSLSRDDAIKAVTMSEY